jgi:outer membrane lipoprotein-sorting protein
MVCFSRFPLLAALFSILLLLPSESSGNSPDLAVVERWLSTNSGVSSLRIEFTQIRRMRSLKTASQQDGVLWLDFERRRFRWQTGNPAQTIVVSLGKDILIIRNPSKRYEVRPAGSGGAPGMSSLVNGFPRTLAEFQAKYRVLEIRPDGHTQRIVTRPLGEAGRGVQTFTFVVDAGHHRLLGMEIDLEDGSALHTVFRKVDANVPLARDLFQPPVDGYAETKF